MDGWEEIAALADPSAIAARIIDECTTFDLLALSNDPLGTLISSPSITVKIEEDLADTGCGGGGYYRPSPPTIHLHPATYRRDNFTLLHELAHHLQQWHDQWGYALIDMDDDCRRAIEEAVCDEFASQVLMPVATGDRNASAVHPADVMAGLFARSAASRSATLQRVRGMLPDGARWILAVADIDGVVTTSSSTYDDASPPKGFAQEGFRQVASEVVDHVVRREFHEGIEYQTGAVLDDMYIEATLDSDGRFVFIALRPTSVSGTGTMTFPAQECSNAECAESFAARDSTGRCATCHSFRCPRCRRCSCLALERPAVCNECFTAYTRAEIEFGNHECL